MRLLFYVGSDELLNGFLTNQSLHRMLYFDSAQKHESVVLIRVGRQIGSGQVASPTRPTQLTSLQLMAWLVQTNQNCTRAKLYFGYLKSKTALGAENKQRVSSCKKQKTVYYNSSSKALLEANAQAMYEQLTDHDIKAPHLLYLFKFDCGVTMNNLEFQSL